MTVCTPSFNRGDIVADTLDSLLAQTFQDWEAIVVDDGSTDDSIDVISRYAAHDDRIRLVLRNREPKGACTCRNIAVELARGRYVLFLDTDDILAPHCLAQRASVMRANPDLDFAIFAMLLFRGSPQTADRYWNVDSDEDDLVRVLRLDPVCQGTGTLWRRDSFKATGMWNESLLVWQDIDLHLRAFSGRFKYIKRLDLPPDTYLRESDESMSRGDYHSREKIASRLRVTREAVRLLREIGREELLPAVRYFCSSVVIGAARGGNYRFAREIIGWGERECVLSAAEARSLELAVIVRQLRLDRLRLVRDGVQRSTRRFTAHTSLGAVPFESE